MQNFKFHLLLFGCPKELKTIRSHFHLTFIINFTLQRIHIFEVFSPLRGGGVGGGGRPPNTKFFSVKQLSKSLRNDSHLYFDYFLIQNTYKKYRSLLLPLPAAPQLVIFQQKSNCRFKQTFWVFLIQNSWQGEVEVGGPGTLIVLSVQIVRHTLSLYLNQHLQ